MSVIAPRSSKWAFKPLGDVFDVIGGGTPSKQESSYYGGSIPWATIRDMQSSHLSATEHSITERGLANSSSNLIPAGEVIMASRVGLGKASILMQDTAINQDIRALIPQRNDSVDRRFLLYWLQNVADEIVAAGTGATVQGVTLPFIKSLSFPFVSIDEQKRIVAKLDQAFAALDRARANAEANLADADELLERASARVIEGKAGGTLRPLRLSEVTSRLTNGYVGPTRDIYRDDGVPYLLARHVRNGSLRFDGRTYVSSDFNQKHSKSTLKQGDVLLVQSGHIGHCAVVPKEHHGHNCHAMIVMTPREELVSGKYLSAVFNTPMFQAEFQRIRTGSTVPHLTCGMVRELVVEVPDRAQQDRIVTELETISSDINAVRSRCLAELEDLESLRKSLLRAAFSGQLT